MTLQELRLPPLRRDAVANEEPDDERDDDDDSEQHDQGTPREVKPREIDHRLMEPILSGVLEDVRSGRLVITAAETTYVLKVRETGITGR